MLTTQIAYERIRKYFNRPDAVYAWDEELEGCVYRKETRNRVLKCAVGCLIPKKFYVKDIENKSIASLLGGITNNVIAPQVEKYFTKVDMFFLSDAQHEHDTLAAESGDTPQEKFIPALDQLAVKYNLKVVKD